MYISIDLGGTKTRIASSKDLKNVYEKDVFKTSQVLETQQEKLLESIEEVSAGSEVDGICIGVPGIVNREQKKLTTIVNVKSLSGLDVEELLLEKYPREKILVENDATLAGLGEAVFGAGSDVDVVAYITLSTGVGGARIANKKVDETQKSVEPGHMIIGDSDKEFSMCGQKGCFSYYCSGTGFEENYGISPIDCDDLAIWNSYAKYLSKGLINVIAMWGPDKIILGGSITKAYDEKFKDFLFKHLSEQNFFGIPPIELAQLGDNSGIFGGFAYLSHRL